MMLAINILCQTVISARCVTKKGDPNSILTWYSLSRIFHKKATWSSQLLAKFTPSPKYSDANWLFKLRQAKV